MSTQEIVDVKIQTSNRSLEGSVFLPLPLPRHGNTTHPGVLFVHGDGSSRRAYCTRAAAVASELQCFCLTFDMSGHGADATNYNKYNAFDHYSDVVAAYDFLCTWAGVDCDRIGVCGASYGAYLAALLTKKRPHCQRLALRAPSLMNDIDPPLPADAQSEFDSLAALRQYTGEVLVIESERDEVIPPSYIALYLNSCAHGQRVVIPEAAHSLTDTRWNEIFTKFIVDWMRRL